MSSNPDIQDEFFPDVGKLPDPSFKPEEFVEEHYFVSLDELQDEGLTREEAIDALSGKMAESIGKGFKYHDEGEMEAAQRYFTFVDVNKSGADAQNFSADAARFYNYALTVKDRIERRNMTEEARQEGIRVEDADPEDFDTVGLYNDPGWKGIELLFEKRAEEAVKHLDWDEEEKWSEVVKPYRDNYTESMRKHRLSEDVLEKIDTFDDKDYSENLQEAIQSFVKAVKDDPEYPRKTSGKGGYGTLPGLYLSGVEAYDTNQWGSVSRIMQIYYSGILEER